MCGDIGKKTIQGKSNSDLNTLEIPTDLFKIQSGFSDRSLIQSRARLQSKESHFCSVSIFKSDTPNTHTSRDWARATFSILNLRLAQLCRKSWKLRSVRGPSLAMIGQLNSHMVVST